MDSSCSAAQVDAGLIAGACRGCPDAHARVMMVISFPSSVTAESHLICTLVCLATARGPSIVTTPRSS